MGDDQKLVFSDGPVPVTGADSVVDGYWTVLIVDDEVMRAAAEVSRWHHEQWNGQGYPDGLAGESIPLVARMTAIADVFDALSHRRVYKEAWSPAEAAGHIATQSGLAFDPELVRIFHTLLPEIMDGEWDTGE